MSKHIRMMVLLVGMAWLFGACDCGDTRFQCPPEKKCKVDEDCSGGLPCMEGCCGGKPQCLEDKHCNQAAGECCRDNRCVTQGCGTNCATPCARDADCKNAGVCLACVNKCCTSYACESDADCPPEGSLPRYCSAFDPELGCRRCDYVRCSSDEQCSDPSFPLYLQCTDSNYLPKCRQGQCVCAHPCGAPCSEPQYCCKKTRTCQDLPDPCPGVECPRCQQLKPQPGGTLNEDECRIDGADCGCEPMPPLPEAFAGLHSALALGPDGAALLSGYYGQPYGDLLFGRAEQVAQGAPVIWQIVDGVPADAPCVGAADGPRGGVAEPGDNVGWDTDIVVNNAGRPFISYYDRTNGDLKFAALQPDGSWQIHAVDTDGDTGRYSSIILDEAGRPVIVYMQVKHQLASAVKLARSNTVMPASAADWQIYTGESVPVPCQPADCAAGEKCLADSGACVVPADPAGCRNGQGCPSGQVCFSGACHPEAKASGLDDLPRGVGVFAQVGLLADGGLALTYYDSARGNLKFAVWDAASTRIGQPVILVGENNGSDTGNLGADLSMQVTLPDERAYLAYQDADLGQLYFMTFSARNPQARTVELVDGGARDAAGDPCPEAQAVGELHRVGNFASLLVDSERVVRIAYQDGTTLDLVYARRQAAGVWSLEILARRLYGGQFVGAYGFFTDQALAPDGRAVISNFRHNLRTDPWSSQIELRVK